MRGMPIGVLVHVLLLVLFTAHEYTVLALYNIFSVLLFAGATILVRRGALTLGASLAFPELILHQALCVHYVGWDAGFQYWLLGLLPAYFLLPRRLLWLSVVYFGFTLVAFVCLYARYGGTAGTLGPPPWLVDMYYLGNLVAVFMVTAIGPWLFAKAVERAETALQVAHQQTEEILFNTMPAEIAARLRNAETVADAAEHVTVLFADIVGFTALAERLAPDALLGLLDEVFTRFDAVVDRLGLEKIKTIGDAYMAAAGVPQPRAEHAPAIAELALAMLTITAEIAGTRGLPLSLRIGVHTGPVVAGVIGRRKFAYDLWGDTVNTAARLESHGLPGEVQISEATRAALGPAWHVESRGTVELKGKGAVQAYLLRGRVAGSPAPA